MEDSKLRELILKYQAEQRDYEVIWFYRHCEKINPRVVVEIGIKEGGNLKVLSTLVPPDGVAVGIDYRTETPWKMDDSACKVCHIKENSHSAEAMEAMKKIVDEYGSIDVLFIDGEHTYEGMLQDFRDYSPLVRSGGIIAVHDIYYLEDVTRAWKDVPGTKIESENIPGSIGIGFVYKE